MLLLTVGSLVYVSFTAPKKNDPCVEAVVVIADYNSMTTCTHPRHRLVPVRERTWLCKCPPYGEEEKAP